MILYPNCKINLGLRVIRKRPDGYHDLETVFVPIYGLHDELCISVRISFSEPGNLPFLLFSGIPDQGTPQRHDGAVLFPAHTPQSVHVAVGTVRQRFIAVKKNIPFGAGLGGGSSDAAHMAIALNELFELGLTKEELAAEIKPLGADCPFFIYNTPCYAEGIGDQLTPIALDLKGIRIVLQTV